MTDTMWLHQRIYPGRLPVLLSDARICNEQSIVAGKHGSPWYTFLNPITLCKTNICIHLKNDQPMPAFYLNHMRLAQEAFKRAQKDDRHKGQERGQSIYWKTGPTCFTSRSCLGITAAGQRKSTPMSANTISKAYSVLSMTSKLPKVMLYAAGGTKTV